MTTSEEGVLFSAGRPLRTFAHIPARGQSRRRLPAVVLAHGLANDCDEAGQFPPLADLLAAEGFLALRFDFRGGRHDIESGRQFPATEWGHDLRAALAQTRARPDVDADRLAVIGASAGGSVALSIGFLEPQLRGIVSLGSPADGRRWMRDLWIRVHGEQAWQGFADALDEDRARRARGLPSRHVMLAGEFLPIPDDEITAVEAFVRANPGMLDRLPLEVADDLLLLRPEAFCPALATRALVMHGTADTLVPVSEANRMAHALRNGEQVILDGLPHQLLLGEGFEEVSGLLLAWLNDVCL